MYARIDRNQPERGWEGHRLHRLMDGTHFRVSVKIYPVRTGAMCLNNFPYDLSIALMPQTFEGFNYLYTKTHDDEIHLNKRKKSAKENGGKNGRLLSVAITPSERLPCNVGSLSIKDFLVMLAHCQLKSHAAKLGAMKKPPLVAAPVA